MARLPAHWMLENIRRKVMIHLVKLVSTPSYFKYTWMSRYYHNLPSECPLVYSPHPPYFSHYIVYVHLLVYLSPPPPFSKLLTWWYSYILPLSSPSCNLECTNGSLQTGALSNSNAHGMIVVVVVVLSVY